MSKKDLLVIGELNIDLILNSIHGFPEVGKEIIADEIEQVLGSSSAIMAAHSSSLGVSTSFCGVIGQDDHGDFILSELKGKNVDTGLIYRSAEYKTGITIIMNYGQDRANVTFCGAMEAMDVHKIPWAEIKDFRHLHISSLFIQKGLKENVLEIFKWAKDMGVSTSLDLQWDPAGKWEFNYKDCLPYVDVFMPNVQELMALTKSGNLQNGIDKVAEYANYLIVKLGIEGSVGIHDNQVINVPAFKTSKYIDAIGAGDSFNAGFIQKFIEKAPLIDCLRQGNLMGALSTTSAGGTRAFESTEVVIRKSKSIFNIDIQI